MDKKKSVVFWRELRGGLQQSGQADLLKKKIRRGAKKPGQSRRCTGAKWYPEASIVASGRDF